MTFKYQSIKGYNETGGKAQAYNLITVQTNCPSVEPYSVPDHMMCNSLSFSQQTVSYAICCQ